MHTVSYSGIFRCGAIGLLPLLLFAACSSSNGGATFDEPVPPGPGVGDEAGVSFEGGFEGEGGNPVPTGTGRDPVSCEEAASFRTYVGCDYWPTVTANAAVQDLFDYAVAVANVGTEPANIKVTGPNGVHETMTVKGGELGKLYLPWVANLKGPFYGAMTASVFEAGGAYHLVSDRPVVVYQFNALEYKAAGGKPGKDWSSCKTPPKVDAAECYSYSNDASLLLPSTAMTGNYRIMGSVGYNKGAAKPVASLPPYFTVTGTAADTTVTVQLGHGSHVVAGGKIAATPARGKFTFTLGAGDVAQVVGGIGRTFDLSGSLLKADKPVQVISGVPCMDFPEGVDACDHLEETVFPVETLGKHYIVPRPTGPGGKAVGHMVRFYGNVDGTALDFKPRKPAGCPDFLNAGEVADCGEVASDFEVSGNKEFGVAMFQLGADKVDSNPAAQRNRLGDPAQSFAVTVEQYRTRYVFLAPDDYQQSYVDVVAASAGTKLTLDGKDVSSSLKPIAGTSVTMARLALGSGKDGAHVLDASAPVGIQVIGYGENTSYQYPGGLNLGVIATVPVK